MSPLVSGFVGRWGSVGSTVQCFSDPLVYASVGPMERWAVGESISQSVGGGGVTAIDGRWSLYEALDSQQPMNCGLEISSHVIAAL